MQKNNKYIHSFLSSLYSWGLYSLETIKIQTLKRLIKWKRELDYRASPEIQHYREQREIEDKIYEKRHREHYQMNQMHNAIKNAK